MQATSFRLFHQCTTKSRAIPRTSNRHLWGQGHGRRDAAQGTQACGVRPSSNRPGQSRIPAPARALRNGLSEDWVMENGKVSWLASSDQEVIRYVNLL